MCTYFLFIYVCFILYLIYFGRVLPEVMTRLSETAALHASAKNIRGVTMTVQLGTCCWLRHPGVMHAAPRPAGPDNVYVFSIVSIC